MLMSDDDGWRGAYLGTCSVVDGLGGGCEVKGDLRGKAVEQGGQTEEIKRLREAASI